MAKRKTCFDRIVWISLVAISVGGGTYLSADPYLNAITGTENEDIQLTDE